MKNLILINVFILLLFTISEAQLQKGDKIPNFKIPSDTGEIIEFKKLKGKWIILYFYPKDNAAGCTKQIKTYSKLIRKFHKYNAEVFGINMDSIESHRNFKNKYRLYLKLLSDTKGELLHAFGIRIIEGFCTRDTVIINKKGKIEKIYSGINPDGDPKEILEYIKKN